MEAILNLFKWIVTAIGEIVTIITSIPVYVTKIVSIVGTFIPAPVGVIFLLCISAYVIIHIKRLVF